MTAVPNHVIIPPMNAIDPARFTHLHVHSHYSLLGGTASVAQLAGRAARDGLKTLALTDNHALYGAVAFDRACRAAGIQPIIGMTAVLPHPTTPPPSTRPTWDKSSCWLPDQKATAPCAACLRTFRAARNGKRALCCTGRS
ncbi:MAG: PHP domain-containing protein [Chloroflexi bacterium]|nr:PHP domain-containing protein [Chloroflexota bacterium]